MNELNRKINQLESMPSASNTYSNQIVQFTGITDILYTHDYMYECQYHRIPSLTGYTSDDSRFTATFDPFRYRAYWNEYIHNYDLDKEEYRLEYNGSEESWFFYNENDDLIEELSTANIQYLGVNINYYGANEPEDGDTVYMDYIPETDESEAPFGYEWVQINVQPSHEVIDDVTSWSTTDALSANQGRLLQEQLDSISAIGTFLAIWDANKQGNNARYLTDGYEYTRGNYFIVGTVDSRTEAGGEYSSHTSAGSIMTSSDKTEPVEYYQAEIDETHTITWNATKQKWVDELGNEFTHSMTSDDGTWIALGFLITSGSSILPAGQLVDGDYVTINIVFPHNYMPTGSEYYITAAGCERTMDDVQISDMYFYDGANWILLANHSKSIAIDSTILPNSKNPAENRAIWSALENKVSKIRQSNVLYGTTAYRETGAITVGQGLQLVDGELSSDVDLSSKQDTLVSGENIKTINGESILGPGNMIIQGGNSDAMGTINIASIDGRSAGISLPEDSNYQGRENYKGNFNPICFTTNADIDYIRQNQNDLYFSFLRRSSNNKAYNVIDDRRYDTDVKVYCWRVPTPSYYNRYEWRWVDYDDLMNRDNTSDINYTYFYTLSDYGDDVQSLVSDNPKIYYAPLSNQDQDTSWDKRDMGFWIGGNWTTNFNQLAELDILSSQYSWVADNWGYSLEDVITRVPEFDITKIANPNNDYLNKMRGRLYINATGEKLYCYAEQSDWYHSNGEIYAALDTNNEPILNYVPSDKNEISYWKTTEQMLNDGWELKEVRNDLTWFRFNDTKSASNIASMISQARNQMENEQDGSGDYDRGWGRYYFDSPICPTRFSECKYLITKTPYIKVWNEEEEHYDYPSDAYAEYMNHAYTLKEIDEDPELLSLFQKQDQIVIVPNWDTSDLWMRIFGWERACYVHKNESEYYDADDEPHNMMKPQFGYDEWDNWTWLQDSETGEYLYENYTLWAESNERHDLLMGMWKSGGISHNDEYKQDPDSGKNEIVMDFDDAMGKRSGIKNNPKWICSGAHKYWIPVQFNICTGHDLTYGIKGKSTPVSKKLTIIGNGTSYIM